MRDVTVYLGPSLDRAEAQSILDANYLPPICRGDLAKLPEETRIVGIVDGEFFQNLAVSPKEVVALLDRGIEVFGAASMGALRAAETCRFGTVGVGEVFRVYRDGVLDGDDEVALAYDRESYAHFSEPLVNMRQALKTALEASVIDETEMHYLVQQMKAYYFPDRSYRALQKLCPRLGDFFRRCPPPDVKRDDARELLFAIREFLESGSRVEMMRSVRSL
jgi:hypothetical protein